MSRSRLVFVVAFVLLAGSTALVAPLSVLVSPAVAASETFRLQWGSYDQQILPQWSSASTLVTLEDWTAPDGSGTGVRLHGPTGASNDHFGGQIDLFFRCGTGNP